MRKLIFLLLLFPLNACKQQNAAGEREIGIVVNSKDDDARWQAVRKLGELKYRPAIPLLIKSLSDPNYYVRANAARALSDMDVVEARGALVELLTRETDGGVIQQATLGIRRFNAVEALPSLRKLANHEDTQTRGWVLRTIGQFGAKEDVSCIASYLESPQITMQSSAAEILGDMTRQDFGVVKSGLSGMGHIGKAKTWWAQHKQYYPECSWGLPKEEYDIAKLLNDIQNSNVSNPDRTTQLIALVDNKDKGIRFSAAQALRHMKDPTAIPTMVRLMDDPDPFFQYLGMMTLCEMNSPGGKGSGCPSRMLFDKSPEKYKTQWKDWWKTKQAVSKKNP